ncbi:MAG: flagellar hook-associated protein FlgK [Rhodospirillaceae bacterium]|nr:flagellar hook-associated protein FlgK [Rhodospirillaceae bacterium]
MAVTASLTGSLSTSISGMAVAQSGLALVSNNVANVNTAGYTRKIAEQQARVDGGLRNGVEIAEIRRNVDRFLAADVRDAGGEAGRYDVQQLFLERLQAAFGLVDSDDTLTGKLDRVFTALETAGATPGSITTRSEIVNALTAMADEIARTATTVNGLRRDADQQMAVEVQTINDALVQIDELNNQISAIRSAGGDATEFEDKRDLQLTKITDRLNVTLFENSTGRLSIFTGGIALLDGSPRLLDFNPAASVEAGTVFDHIEVFRRDPATGEPTGPGAPLEGSINTGRIKGLLDLRDGELDDLVIELGELASRIADELNRIHNDNTAFPAPSELTGSRNTGLVGTDSLNFSGSARFSVLDSDGLIVDTVTVDLSALATVQDAIDAVNAGLAGNATMSLTNGVLSLAADDPANGVAVAQDETTPSDRGGRGFAHFFGLNDLMTTSSGAFFESGFVATDTHGFTGDTTVRVFDNGGSVVKEFTFDAGAAGVTFTDLVNALNSGANLDTFGTAALDSDGRLSVTPANGFTIRFDDELNADRLGTGIGLASLMGLGEDKVALNAESLAVRSDVAGDPTLIGLGKLQPSAVGEPGITAGDGRGARALAGLAATKVQVNAAGSLPGQSLTLGEYAGSVIGGAALYAGNVEDLGTQAADLHSQLKIKLDGLSAVNIDEELSNMIVLQNAFAASARVISTIDGMFDDLLSIAR